MINSPDLTPFSEMRSGKKLKTNSSSVGVFLSFGSAKRGIGKNLFLILHFPRAGAVNEKGVCLAAPSVSSTCESRAVSACWIQEPHLLEEINE